jgi:transcriptional regulator with XRE-family HTH domain
MKNKTFYELFESAQSSATFKSERAILDFTSELNRFMQQKNISKAEFARLIKKSPPYVSKIFRGDANFTIQTMTRLADALGGRIAIHVTERESAVKWFGLIEAKVIQGTPVSSPQNKPTTKGTEFKYATSSSAA